MHELKDLINKRVVIHCKTAKEAKRLLKMLHDLGGHWCSGDDLNDLCFYNSFGSETCYDLSDITHLTLCEIGYFKSLNENYILNSENYQIIEFTNLEEI